MIKIKVNYRKGEQGANGVKAVDQALRKLKRAVTSTGLLNDLRENRYFEKPGDKKRKKSAKARIRAKREQKMKDKGLI